MSDVLDEHLDQINDLYDLHKAGFPVAFEFRAMEPEMIRHMADRVRGEKRRPEGPYLSADDISDEDLYEIAQRGVEKPASLTLNEIRVLGDYVINCAD